MESWFSREMMMLYGVLVTFIVGIINIFVSLGTNRRTVFVNAVTSERVKWMSELKELVSEYLSLVTYYEQKAFLEGENLTTYFERLIYLQNKIKLHLNYTDAKDQEIISLIEKINKKFFALYNMKTILDLPEGKRLESLPVDYIESAIKASFGQDKELFKSIVANPNLNNEKMEQLRNKTIENLNVNIKKDFGNQFPNELKADTANLVDKVRKYLKEEWEKVKEEAKKGKLNSTAWYKRIKWDLGKWRKGKR